MHVEHFQKARALGVGSGEEEEEGRGLGAEDTPCVARGVPGDPHQGAPAGRRQMRARTRDPEGRGQGWPPGPRPAGGFQVSPWGSSVRNHFPVGERAVVGGPAGSLNAERVLFLQVSALVLFVQRFPGNATGSPFQADGLVITPKLVAAWPPLGCSRLSQPAGASLSAQNPFPPLSHHRPASQRLQPSWRSLRSLDTADLQSVTD